MNTKNMLLGLLIVAVFATGFMIGRFSSIGDTYNSGPASTTEENVADTTAEGGTTVQTSSLSDGQKNY